MGMFFLRKSSATGHHAELGLIGLSRCEGCCEALLAACTTKAGKNRPPARQCGDYLLKMRSFLTNGSLLEKQRSIDARVWHGFTAMREDGAGEAGRVKDRILK
ncbi:hypothetical protein [Rhizobium paknamense]|uniref:Uncharacterized protein n=1 Tax=Rhizobium paknamense TaxID=1206817 RepID=A0ABU0IHG3_9HYPH|nr:hypothetical protein [Rhizobium paknamense]MDQ0457102.1 hypothetical protein [Rhizobium paknamense]